MEERIKKKPFFFFLEMGNSFEGLRTYASRRIYKDLVYLCGCMDG
jgi:hypothetical protein